jgi:hypothetical protein
MIHYHLIHECGLRPDEVAAQLKGWEIVHIVFGDQTVGEVMLKGSEVHLALSRAWRGKALLHRAEFSAFVAGLLDARKFLVTRTRREGDRVGNKLARVLGFVQTHSDDRFNYWWLDTPPWSPR